MLTISLMNRWWGGKRRYNLIQNSDGTYSLEDVTVYKQIGSDYNSMDINATNEAINESADKNKILDTLEEITANTQPGYMAGALAVNEINTAVSQINSNLQGLTESLACKNFTLLGSVSYNSQDKPKKETITLNDNVSNYKKVLIGIFDGNNMINPAILTVSEFKNINFGIRIFEGHNASQGIVGYVSDTTCTFTSYNQTINKRDVVLYGIN